MLFDVFNLYDAIGVDIIMRCVESLLDKVFNYFMKLMFCTVIKNYYILYCCLAANIVTFDLNVAVFLRVLLSW